MWPKTFSGRLESWNLLRDQCKNLSTQQCLSQVNLWWFGAPWRPYYLHWDDQATWPDPWQLLSDDIYCDLARGLGILYTIELLDRTDIASADLVLTESGYNLVLVDQTKYILNWERDTIVNTFQEVKIHRKFQHHPIV